VKSTFFFLIFWWNYGVGEKDFFEILVRLMGWRETFSWNLVTPQDFWEALYLDLGETTELVRLWDWWVPFFWNSGETTELVSSTFFRCWWDYGVGEKHFFWDIGETTELVEAVFWYLVGLRGWREAVFWDFGDTTELVEAVFWNFARLRGWWEAGFPYAGETTGLVRNQFFEILVRLRAWW